jgi:hypothetical protein
MVLCECNTYRSNVNVVKTPDLYFITRAKVAKQLINLSFWHYQIRRGQNRPKPVVSFRVVDVHHTKKTTPTRWWRKRRTAGANVAKTAGQVERNHSRTTAGRNNINKITPTRWWRKLRTAGANVTKTAGQVERNHNSVTAGRYNTNKEDTNTRSGQVDDA